MINADIIFHAGIDYNYALPISSIIYINEDGDEVDYSDGESIWTGEPYIDHWNEDGGSSWAGYADKAMNTGGLSIKVGIDYSLGSLGFDLVGFLDPLKKY